MAFQSQPLKIEIVSNGQVNHKSKMNDARVQSFYYWSSKYQLGVCDLYFLKLYTIHSTITTNKNASTITKSLDSRTLNIDHAKLSK